MKIDPELVGKRLHEAIERAGKTRDDVAQAAEVSTGTIQKWQSAGQQPGLFDFARAASYLGVSVDTLLGFDSNRAALLDAETPPRQAVAAGLDLMRLPLGERRAVMLIVASLLGGTSPHRESGTSPRVGSGRTARSRKGAGRSAG